MDAAAVRAINSRVAATRKLLEGLVLNVVAAASIVSAVLLGTKGQINSPYVVLSVGSLFASLIVGCMAATAVRRGEARLWADAWARSHLVLFAHWLVIPVSGLFLDLELEGVVVLVTIWLIAAVVSMCAVGFLFNWLCRRRGLYSRSGTIIFAIVQAVMSIATVASFIYLVVRMALDSLDFCC